MKKLITLAQISCDAQGFHSHIERIKAIIAQYRASDLIVFPELILHGHPSRERPEGFLFRRIEGRERRLSEDMAAYVRELDARIVIGEIRRKGDAFYNLATYMDYTTVQSYAKVHVHWTERFIPGRDFTVLSTPAGRLGMTVCFDSAFCEIGRILALRGAQVIVNISAVPRSFPVKYMRRRLVALALNNQVFVVYVNRPGPFFSGASAVFDPRGDILVHAGNGEEVLQVEIDLEEIRSWREEENIYDHRRPLLYREIGAEKQKRRGGRSKWETITEKKAYAPVASSRQTGDAHG
ncbi:MAG: carbon-nitrogen hydrolase family protein [Pseudomonadota bacterium]|nr:carbon-nitrogen hydrolase family protein [Pseudomonadota bacterium]